MNQSESSEINPISLSVLIHWMEFASVFFCGVIAFVLSVTMEELLVSWSTFRILFISASFICLSIIVFIVLFRSYWFSPYSLKNPDNTDEPDDMYLKGSLIQGGAIEIIAVLGFVLSVLYMTFVVFLPFAGTALFLFFLFRPSKNDFQRRLGRSGTSSETQDYRSSTEFPEVDLPPFDPEEFRQHKAWMKPEFTWQPGKRITIEVPAISFLRRFIYSSVIGVWCFFVIGMGLGFLAIMLFMGELSLYPGWFILFGAIGLTGGLIAWYRFGQKLCRRRTEIDWTDNHVKIEVGNRTRSGPIEDVKAIIVEGKQTSFGGKFNYCDIILDMRNGREIILRTGSDKDRKELYRKAGSMAKELSQALDVDWKWKGFEIFGTAW